MRPVDDGMLDPSRRLLHEEQLRLDAIEVDMHAPRGRMLVPLIPLVLPPLLVRCSCAEGAAGGCALVPVDHAPVALTIRAFGAHGVEGVVGRSRAATTESDGRRAIGGYAAGAPALVDGWVARPRVRLRGRPIAQPVAVGVGEVSHAQQAIRLGVAQHSLLVLALQDAHACSN
eukprot:CAMPEP_0180192698 /NCGR_PEP_ID=MMETSP0987-20121128/2110_1 /TAXON_ID=697907 /ORGANISM="non described non described, Strain CCMP2293" /LENGTH=172 /DNA_ID=CAMNT_0022147325 /DNA_START=470 /DNA_END=988 /DNA_ORIENTATION=-